MNDAKFLYVPMGPGFLEDPDPAIHSFGGSGSYYSHFWMIRIILLTVLEGSGF